VKRGVWKHTFFEIMYQKHGIDVKKGKCFKTLFVTPPLEGVSRDTIATQGL